MLSLVADRADVFHSKIHESIEKCKYGFKDFKFVRVDFIHRINYLDPVKNPEAKPFGVKVNFVLKF